MVRFFSGSRDNTKKNSAAVEAFKKKMNGSSMPEVKKTPAEEFQDRIDARAMDMMKEYMLGNKKKATGLLGSKKTDKPEPGAEADFEDEVKKQMSPNAKKMFQQLAREKMMKDMKKEKKNELAYQAQQKKLKKQEEALKTQQAYDVEIREKAYQEQYNTSNDSGTSFFWGE